MKSSKPSVENRDHARQTMHGIDGHPGRQQPGKNLSRVCHGSLLSQLGPESKSGGATPVFQVDSAFALKDSI